MAFDHLLVIGFGAPEKQEDVPEFLRIVTRGVPVPEERLREVACHYEAIGGGSPYNRHTCRLIEAMKKKLFDRSISLPVFTGMRNWHPFMKDTVAEIKKKGFRKGIGIVLAPHRSDASWDKYLRTVEEAKKESGARVEYEYLRAWHDHPGFIDAQADQVIGVIANSSSPNGSAKQPPCGVVGDPRLKPCGDDIHLLFTAHSIPIEMAKNSKYAEEIKISSQLVARKLNHKKWSMAYQSRSGGPGQLWLEPDVNSRIRELAAAGTTTVLLVPIGFLCDNAEVLYDLDIEAKAEVEKAGMRYLRASTVMDHPRFADMLAALIQQHVIPAHF